MMHLYHQNGFTRELTSPTSESDHSGSLLDDVKVRIHFPKIWQQNSYHRWTLFLQLELNAIPAIITNESKTMSNSSNEEQIQETQPKNDAEAHIYKMGKIKQLVYL